MKKGIIVAAILLGSLSIYAATNPISENNKIETIQSDYTEVSVDSLPVAVKTAIEKGFPGAKITKAYVNEKKEYKLELSVIDQQTTAYTDVNGNLLK